MQHNALSQDTAASGQAAVPAETASISERAITYNMRGNHLGSPYAYIFEGQEDGSSIAINSKLYSKFATDGYRGLIGPDAIAAFMDDFQSEAAKILKDPHGEASIDQQREGYKRNFRTVHRIDNSPLAEQLGQRLAAKTNGTDMDQANRVRGRDKPLDRAFKDLLDTARAQEDSFPDGVGGRLFINEPYAYIRQPDSDNVMHEWILSPYIQGESVDYEVLAMAGSDASAVTAFHADQYPDLVELVPAIRRHDIILFSDLAESLSYRMGLLGMGKSLAQSPLKDLHGENVLKQQADDGRNIYTIIDV
jgi:hypothetical protein